MVISVLYFERHTNTRLQTGSGENILFYLLMVQLMKSNFAAHFALAKFAIFSLTTMETGSSAYKLGTENSQNTGS